MDMTIPLILLLHIGGNILLFYGLFSLLKLTIFKEKSREEKEPEDKKAKQELKRLKRELKKL